MKLLVYGSKGWIGTQFMSLVEKYNTIEGKSRLDNIDAVKKEIDLGVNFQRPSYIEHEMAKVFLKCCRGQPDHDLLEEIQRNELEEPQEPPPELTVVQPGTGKGTRWCEICAKEGRFMRWLPAKNCPYLQAVEQKTEGETAGNLLTTNAEVHEERCQFCAASSKEHGIFKCPRLGEGLARMVFSVVEKEGSPAEIRLPKAFYNPEISKQSSPTWPPRFDVRSQMNENARGKKNGSSVQIADEIHSEPVLKVTILKRPTSARSNSSSTATSARLRKSYEQRKEEYAQARLRILTSSGRKKEPP